MEKLYTGSKTRPGADYGSDHELLIAKFRLKLKKVGKTTRPFRYDLNHDSSKALSKDQKVSRDPTPKNLHSFPKIVGIILPLICL